jgi:phospholipid/cholesterol/gamma-HCH transport system permease protein
MSASLAVRGRAALTDAGELVLLFGRVVRRPPRLPVLWHDVIEQIEQIGARSLAVVVLTAVFSSLVMTVQFAVQLARFGAKEYVGNVVAVSLVRELGPVLTALMVGGRVGAGITAELGSMAVTEQIDAMRVMCADPVARLVTPRVLAAAIALPLLTIIADVLGITAGTIMGAWDTHVSLAYFYSTITEVVDISDVMGGLIKTIVFGTLIALIACHRGLGTRGGTQGVGSATTRTVVVTSITTLITDFLLTKGLLAFGL